MVNTRKRIVVFAICFMVAVAFCGFTADTSFAGTSSAKIAKTTFSQIPTTMGVRSSALDKDGNLWIGTYGGGIYKKDAKTGEMTVYTQSSTPALKTGTVSSICPDDKGGVWFTQNKSHKVVADCFGIGYLKDGEVTYYDETDNPKTVPSNYCSEIRIDKEGKVYFGCIGGLTMYDPAADTWTSYDEGFPASKITGEYVLEEVGYIDNMEIDKDGGIWCGFYPDCAGGNDGVHPYVGGFAYFKDGKVVHSYQYTSEKEGDWYRLQDVWIRDIAIDKKGGIWFIASAIYGGMKNIGGKVYYLKSTDAEPVEYTGFELFGEKAFTENSELRTIDIDSDGGLWFGTSKDGVFRVDNNTIKKGKLTIDAKYNSSKGSWTGESSGIDNIYDMKFLGRTLAVGSSEGLQLAVTASLKSAAAGKKKLTVKWRKSSDAAGYQVYLKQKGKTAKTYLVKKSALSKTIKKLKSGKKYTAKVRAYVKDNGQKKFGTWSREKTVKVK